MYIYIYIADEYVSLTDLLIRVSCVSNRFVSQIEEYRFVEFFAGDGNLTWSLRRHGFRGLKLDKDYGGRYNNIFEPAGFALRVCRVEWELCFEMSWGCER